MINITRFAACPRILTVNDYRESHTEDFLSVRTLRIAYRFLNWDCVATRSRNYAVFVRAKIQICEYSYK